MRVQGRQKIVLQLVTRPSQDCYGFVNCHMPFLQKSFLFCVVFYGLMESMRNQGLRNCQIQAFTCHLYPFHCQMQAKANFDHISKFHFVNFEKQRRPCESTGKALSFEWSHHRILSTESKVRVALQNSENQKERDCIINSCFFFSQCFKALLINSEFNQIAIDN